MVASGVVRLCERWRYWFTAWPVMARIGLVWGSLGSFSVSWEEVEIFLEGGEGEEEWVETSSSGMG